MRPPSFAGKGAGWVCKRWFAGQAARTAQQRRWARVGTAAGPPGSGWAACSCSRERCRERSGARCMMRRRMRRRPGLRWGHRLAGRASLGLLAQRKPGPPPLRRWARWGLFKSTLVRQAAPGKAQRRWTRAWWVPWDAARAAAWFGRGGERARSCGELFRYLHRRVWRPGVRHGAPDARRILWPNASTCDGRFAMLWRSAAAQASRWRWLARACCGMR